MNPADRQDPPGQPPAQGANGQPSPQANGAPASTEGDRPMTLAEFTRERNSMFADMRRMVEGIVKPPKPSTTATTTEPPAAQPAQVDVTAAIRREREISEAMGDFPHLGREQRALVRRLIDAENPSDVPGFVATQAKLFVPPGQPPSTPNPAAPNPTGRPVSDGGAPASTPPITEDTPLWKMDPISRQKLINEKGLSWYRDTLRKQAKGQSVKLRDG